MPTYVLDVVKELLIQHFHDKIKNACEETLRLFVTTKPILCDKHYEWGCKLVNRSLVNIYYNGEQKKQSGAIRKDAVKEFKSRQIRKRKLTHDL